MRSSLPSLDVFESDIVDLFSPREGMMNVAKHLSARWPDIDFLGGHPEDAHEVAGVSESELARSKARHRIREDILSWKAQPIHCFGRDDECLGRVQAAGNPNNDAFGPGAGKSL